MGTTDNQTLWWAEYIPGKFKKAISQKIILSNKDITVTGYDSYTKKAVTFDIEYPLIKSITHIKGFNDVNGICIEFIGRTTPLSLNRIDRIVHTYGYDNIQALIKTIMTAKKEYEEEQAKQLEQRDKTERERLERELEKKEQERQRLMAMQKFYDDCFCFHISNANNPYYTFHSDKNILIALYVDKSKGLNFLCINGNEKEETCSVISYEKIHYYEKAGTIHYVSNTNGNFSSFGGSFTGPTFSKPAALISGLLFGPMGMIAGALFSSKPAQHTAPTTTLNLTSELQKIDERNVILNYYSDAHGQYIDIELPADIFNFLQTHLPDKKHAIVIELEKAVAVRDTIEALPPVQETPKLQTPATSASDDIDSFRQKAEKLKIMHEAGLITDEEFAAQKTELMKQIL